jgi:hypothetical protein
MTTFEHAMLGATGAMAAGLHRRGWEIVAVATVAAVLPDWDGLSLLFGASAYDRFHRVLGHSVFTATLIALGATLAEYHFRLLPRCRTLLARYVQGIPEQVPHPEEGSSSPKELRLWLIVAVLATASHLVADILFSGHATLSDWGLKVFWPFSDHEYAFPVVRWGDPLPTVILVAGMFAMLRWRTRVQGLAALTLAALVGYIAIRASFLPYS